MFFFSLNVYLQYLLPLSYQQLKITLEDLPWPTFLMKMLIVLSCTFLFHKEYIQRFLQTR